jgi:hypothetical protein
MRGFEGAAALVVAMVKLLLRVTHVLLKLLNCPNLCNTASAEELQQSNPLPLYRDNSIPGVQLTFSIHSVLNFVVCSPRVLWVLAVRLC